ncbi:MAG: endopeptidase La, partial [Hyphomicrobiaceae bacterium]|nr:endopeptidase La [Hyphomicrobiaceae bacterium]
MDELTPALELPEELPVLPLREFVVFPNMVLPLFVGRERSIAAVEDALASHRMLLLVAQRDPAITDPEPEDLFRVGTAAMILRDMRLPDGRLKVIVQGVAKVRIDAFIEQESSSWVRVSALPSHDDSSWCVESEALIRAVRSRVEELLPLKDLPPEVISITTSVDNPGRLADLVASNLNLRLAETQEVLEVQDSLARLRRVDALLRRELEVTTMEAEIRSQAKQEMSRGEREVFLREQLRAIQSELGEVDPRTEEADEYRVKVEEADLPEEAREEALRQLRRLERMHPDGPEAQVVRNYLDWLVELPWTKTSADQLDLCVARDILNTDHAHLESVKDRILEFLGVRKLRNDSRGPILCFVGPPGVGKTSLGRSIARAMGRKFARISLGGVRDEAEIRGHRRTYIGALPGKIIHSLQKIKVNNPVFCLDEVDKMSMDFRGDPSSALLEVLDPEQNNSFNDHYLDLDYDLSDIFFITTANNLHAIPAPLQDRMEVIKLNGYTEEDKLQIVNGFLAPKQLELNGFGKKDITFASGSILEIVRRYTREAGVRNLERSIASICRKVARDRLKKKIKK